MAHINRRFIDKHWLVFVIRGGIAAIFGVLGLFGALSDFNYIISIIIIYLLLMGIIDATSALYNSVKKHGWVNSVIDALVDIVAALALLFLGMNDFAISVVILALYTAVSGIIDIIHGFISTVDPTDRFIRIVAGVVGIVVGFVILNSGGFGDKMIFARFFGVYLIIVGITSMVYGVHNRAQKIEDSIARSEARKATAAKAKLTRAKNAKKSGVKKSRKK